MTAAVLFALCLAGCGKSAWDGADAQVTTIGVDEEGHVLEIVIEDFSEDYYDADELRTQIESDVETYNGTKGGEAVKLNSLTVNDGVVRMSTSYQSTDDYGAFTMEPLFFGKVKQGRFRGFELPSSLTDREGAAYAVRDADAERTMIYSVGHDHLATPYKIIAVSEGVTVVSDYEADLTGSGERAVILMEK